MSAGRLVALACALGVADPSPGRVGGTIKRWLGRGTDEGEIAAFLHGLALVRADGQHYTVGGAWACRVAGMPLWDYCRQRYLNQREDPWTDSGCPTLSWTVPLVRRPRSTASSTIPPAPSAVPVSGGAASARIPRRRLRT